MNKRGFATLEALAVVLVLIVAGGIWYYETQRVQPTSGAAAPVITSISPNSGCLDGASLVITGHGFGSQDTVAFGVYGETMTVNSNGESITVNMPPPGPPEQLGPAIKVPTADPVIVISDGVKSNAVVYTLTCGENTTNP